MIPMSKNYLYLAIILKLSIACSQEGLVPVDESAAPEAANAQAIPPADIIGGESDEQQDQIAPVQTEGEEDQVVAEPSPNPTETENLLGAVSLQVGTLEYTTDTQVSLILAAEGAAEMYITNSSLCLEGGVWEPFAESKEWTLGQRNELATVYAKYRDVNGNESACVNDTVLHDDLGPSINTISIDDDAGYTQSTQVVLSISANDAIEMYITEVEDCVVGGTWEPYTNIVDWVLSQTNTEAALYVKFRDSIGNESPCEFDTIIHDDFAPANTGIAINADAQETDINQVALNLTADDAFEMYVSNTAGCMEGGAWEPYQDTKVWGIAPAEQLATVYVKFRDEAGNESPCINDTITFNPNLDCNRLSGDWVYIPGDADFGTSNFCIMKFEAKDVNNVATSQWELEPWVNISQNNAKAKCSELGLGYRLISNEQWMTAGANIAGNAINWIDPNNSGLAGVVGTGLLVEGHSDDNPNSACEAAADDLDRHVRSGSCDGVRDGNVDQRRTHQVLSSEANNVIWDLAGNAEEWTDYYDPVKPVADNTNEIYRINDAGSDLKINHLIPIDKGFWGATWGSDEGIGRFFSGDANVGGAMFRGGSWDENSNSGIFEVNLNLGPDDASDEVGFRCVYGP